MEDNKNVKVLKGRIEIRTGLHIGGISETKIGGIDSPVIKAPNGLPYIPGSSLKGKIRSIKYLLDNSKTETEDLFDMFGRSGAESKTKNSIGTLIFRDSFLNIEETCKNLEIKDKENIKKIIFEEKAENKIDKLKGTALSPRFIERVKKGCVFDFEIIIRKVDDRDINKHYFELVKLLKYLEESDYLGGSGTRGYGYLKIIVE